MNRTNSTLGILLLPSTAVVKRRIIPATFLIFLSFIFHGCGSDEADPPVLTTITVQSSNGSRLDLATQGETVLSVSGVDQFGNSFENTTDPQWTADNNNVSVDQNGKVVAQAVGTSVVTAEVDNVRGSFTVSVWDSSAPASQIYVSDVGVNRNGPHRILKYDESGVESSTFINTGVSKPQDIVFIEDQGVVLVSNLSSNNINKFDIESGNFIGAFATGLLGPTRIDIGPDNLLYAVPWNGGAVKRYQLDGTFVDDFTSIGISQAIGMAWDNSGNYYVSSFNNGTNGFVRKFDSEGNDLGAFISNNLSGPTDIWFDTGGNMFVNDWSGNSVKKFNASGVFQQVFISNVSQPEGVGFLDDGSILIGASGTSSVKMYTSTGTFVKDLVRPGGGGLNTPNAVVVRKVNQ